MANTPNLGLRKIDAKTEKFNQKLNYEDNFDKIDLLAGEIRAGKVDKVTGKVLSTNDYTTLEKTKLSKAPDDTNASLAAVTTRVNDIITTPVPVGEVIAQEIIDARQGKLSVGANITEVKTQLADNTAKLKDITQINIRDYGAKSHEEVANFDNISALKNVIAYANSIGGHTKIFIPKGTWKFGATPVDMPIISENGVWFAGDNEDVTLLQFTSGTYFTWGSVNKGVEGGGIEKLSLEYLVSNAEYPTIKNIYSFGVTIRNVKGKNLSRLIEVGSRNNPVGIKPQSIKIHNCTFISAIDKANISLIKLIYGAVFECNDVFASVPIPQVMGQNNVLENVNFLEVNGS